MSVEKPAARPRPGGRSARIESAVHEAVRRLQATDLDVSVPSIAREAGVTPSTVYRRWGGLPELLAHVAARRSTPGVPADTGSLRNDVLAWAQAYAEELASAEGRRYLRELVAGSAMHGYAVSCGEDTREVFQLLLARAAARGEPPPARVTTSTLVERVAAPIVYSILFDHQAADRDAVQKLVSDSFGDDETHRP